jgi:hypothetical protein
VTAAAGARKQRGEPHGLASLTSGFFQPGGRGGSEPTSPVAGHLKIEKISAMAASSTAVVSLTGVFGSFGGASSM